MRIAINNRFIPFLVPLVIVLNCAIVILNLQLSKANQLKTSGLNEIDYDRQAKKDKIRLETINSIPSFGFDNLIANWSMLQFLQYFGDGEARTKTGYSLSTNYLETIIEKDPRFTQAYLILSPASSMFAGQPRKTVSLLEQGLTKITPSLPNAYFVWLYKGIDEILYFGDTEKAKKSYEKAAEWAKIAGNKKIEQAARDTVKFLSTNPDIKQAQVGAWFMVWVNNKDQQIRQLAQRKIEELGGTLEVYPDGRVVAKPPKPANS